MTDQGLGDASRRTWLALERTFLAWCRNSLGAFAVAIAVGGILPRLTHNAPRWPYVVAGAGYGVLGVGYLAYGLIRQQTLESAVAQGRFLRLTQHLAVSLTAFTVIVGVYSTVVVLVAP